MRRLGLILLLALPLVPVDAFASPTFSAEFDVSDTIFNGYNAGYNPKVSAGNDQALVVWSAEFGGPGIYGERVDAAGNLVGRIETISQGWSPVVGFDGTNYVVAWFDQPDSIVGSLVVTRVSPNGQLVDAVPLTISSPFTVSFRGPCIAGGPSQSFLVSWADLFGSQWFAVVAADGGVTHLEATDSGYGECAAAFDGTNFLLLTNDSQVVEARLLSPGGIAISPPFLVSSTIDSSPDAVALAWNDETYLATWRYFPALLGVRISIAGTVLDASPITIAASASSVTVAAQADGGPFAVVWPADPSGSYIAYVDAIGAVTNDPTPFPRNPNGFEPTSIAPLGAGFLVVGGGAPVEGVTIDLNGDAGSPFVVSLTADGQAHPRAFVVDGGFVAEWMEFNGDRVEIRVQRILTDGGLVDGTGLLLVDAGHDSPSGFAPSDRGYMVAWASAPYVSTNAVLKTAVFGWDGGVLENLSTTVVDPAWPLFGGVMIESNDDAYLVAWIGQTNVLAQRFDLSGAPIDPAPFVLLDERFGGAQSIRSTVIDGTFVVLIAGEIALVGSHGPPLYDGGIAFPSDRGSLIASGGDVLLAVNSEINPGIVMFLASDGGTLLGAQPQMLPTQGTSPQNLALTFDGTNFLVSWCDSSGVVHGLHVSPHGDVVDDGGYLMFATDGGAQEFDIAAGPESLMVFSKYEDTLHTNRVRGVLFSGSFETDLTIDSGIDGGRDAGIADAGEPSVDAGIDDAGSGVDGGISPAPAKKQCGCTSASGLGGLIIWLLALRYRRARR